jgi:hypothetical protein
MRGEVLIGDPLIDVERHISMLNKISEITHKVILLTFLNISGMLNSLLYNVVKRQKVNRKTLEFYKVVYHISSPYKV